MPGRRDLLLAYFAGLEQGDAILLWGDRAGQGLYLESRKLRIRPLLGGGPRTKDRPTTESDRPTTESGPAETRYPQPHYGAVEGDDTLCLLVPPSPKEKPSSSSNQEEEQLRKATNVLAAAVAAAIGKPGIYRTPLQLLRELVGRYPDHLDDLEGLVPSLKGIFGPEEAVTALAQRADALAARGWTAPSPRVMSEEAALRTKIETWRRAGEDVSELEARLQGLMGGVAS